MSGTTYVLLPPSESKEPGGRLAAAPGLFDVALDEARAAVRAALASLVAGGSSHDLSRVFKVRGALLERAVDATRQLVEGRAPTLPAWQRYRGVVWNHLDAGTLEDRCRERILVPSGLYGLSTASDEIVDYRLTMKVSLAPLGNLATYWRPVVTTVLQDIAGAEFVSLLPREHASALATGGPLAMRTTEVRFVDHHGEGVVGHDAKAVKGVVARRILTEGIEVVDGLRWRGWRGRLHRGNYEVRAPREPRRVR